MTRRRPFAAAVGDDVALTHAALERLAAWRATYGDAFDDPDVLERELAGITRCDDIDLAVAFLDAWLRAHPRHGPFIRRIERTPDTPRVIDGVPTLLIVPGMFHHAYPELGADGRLIRDIAGRFGLDTELAPTDGLGSVADNAVRLHRHLSDRPATPFWLVSISRGSADVRAVLRAHPDAPYLASLRHWISVCGIVAGSALYERAHRSRAGAFLFGLGLRGLGGSRALSAEMQRGHPLWQPPHPPPAVRATHVIALPSSWDVSTPVVRRYRALVRHGPTDGIVRLSDYCRQPGRLYPIRGVDHLLRGSALSGHLYRLLHSLGDEP